MSNKGKPIVIKLPDDEAFVRWPDTPCQFGTIFSFGVAQLNGKPATQVLAHVFQPNKKKSIPQKPPNHGNVRFAHLSGNRFLFSRDHLNAIPNVQGGRKPVKNVLAVWANFGTEDSPNWVPETKEFTARWGVATDCDF
ncbi:MAG: hypothetical protein HYS13_11525 [Planctomycetia bacterium]|nr:hypothetical protein [Planctomycetia bacterium]